MIADSKIMLGDCRTELDSLPTESIQSCITSPPYWGLRNYGTGDDQLGLEPSPEEYTENMVKVFDGVKRVLKPSGTLWLNLGDTYCGTGDKGDGKDPKHKEGRNWDGHKALNNKIDGLKKKDLVGIPWRVAFALQADGWYLRQDIIWSKPNAMPEPVKDRCTKSHEHIFLLSKSQNYFYDCDAVADTTSAGTRNKRDVWSVNTQPYKDAHFATFPEKLIEPCILAGTQTGDTVLDPFTGSGTTGKVSVENSRNFVGVEINPDYKKLAEGRINSAQPPLLFNSQNTNTVTKTL
tara:strand:+ start:2366 stop:3241 length:876 start_codon:yes stop_codon:yes gene_type:complete